MIRALITQRQSIDKYGSQIDTLEDSYVTFFEKLNILLLPISNNILHSKKIFNNIDFNLIIFTGGGFLPIESYDRETKILYGDSNYYQQNKRNQIENNLIQISIKKKIPIIAICRGMQYINAYLGGKISNLSYIKVKRDVSNDHDITVGIYESTILVNSFHDDGIFLRNLSKPLKTIALDKENNIVEAFHSRKLKWLGLQWHPERYFSSSEGSNFTKKLIEQFIFKKGVINESYYIGSR